MLPHHGVSTVVHVLVLLLGIVVVEVLLPAIQHSDMTNIPPGDTLVLLGVQAIEECHPVHVLD